MKKLILATLVAGLCFLQGTTSYATETNSAQNICVEEKQDIKTSGVFQDTIQWRIVGDTLELYSKSEKAVLPDASTVTLPWEEYKDDIKYICINSDISEIGPYMFEKMSALEEVQINTTSLVKIGTGAFYGCTKLKKINLPDNLKEIDMRAFADCRLLKEISENGLVLPSGLSEISTACFMHCKSLNGITIPANVKKIGAGAFWGSGLQELYFEKGNLEVIDMEAFAAVQQLKSVILPETIHTINSYAFERCISLETVVFEDKGTLKTTDKKIFDGCSALKNIYVNSNNSKMLEYCNNDPVLKAKCCVRTSMTATGKNFSVSFKNNGQNCTYTGKKLEPDVLVMYWPEDKELKEGTDYTVSYVNNINVGTGKVIITGIRAFEGTLEEEFTIIPKSLSKAVVTLDKSNYFYNSITEREIKPQVKSVVLDGKTLVAGKDYKIFQYTDNDRITKDATVEVEGIGNYTDYAKKQFSICYDLKKNSKNISVQVTKNAYTGKAVKPSLTVSYKHGDGWSVISKSNYKAVYSNNKKIGKNAKVTITGKGLFTGKITKKFPIAPQKPKVKKIGKLLKISNYQEGAEVRVTYTVKIKGKEKEETLVCKANDYKKKKGVDLTKVMKKYKGKTIKARVTMKYKGVESVETNEIIVR